jgi:hypothetical protein
MSGQEGTSEAQVQVQEQTGDVTATTVAAVPAGAASGAGAQVQEQPNATVPQEGQRPQEILGDPELREQYRRQVQSEADKRALKIRQEMERQAQLAAQQKYLEEMDDETYGRTMRSQLQQQAYAQQVAQRAKADVLRTTYEQLMAQTLETVSDQKARADLQRRVEAGEFPSFGAFQAAAAQAEVDARLAKERARLEKQIREAAQKEATADVADTVAPMLGAGLPNKPDRKYTRDELISLGIAEAMEKARKGG